MESEREPTAIVAIDADEDGDVEELDDEILEDARQDFINPPAPRPSSIPAHRRFHQVIGEINQHLGEIVNGSAQLDADIWDVTTRLATLVWDHAVFYIVPPFVWLGEFMEDFNAAVLIHRARRPMPPMPREPLDIFYVYCRCILFIAMAAIWFRGNIKLITILSHEARRWV